MNERELFIEARAINDPQRRQEFLDSACGSDQSLRQRIDSLLAADISPDSFLSNLDATLEREPICEQPGDSIGPYRLLQSIGEGGFGVVFMAEQVEPVRRTVALKVIRPGMDSRQVIARFEAERQALAMMDHPHIAKVLDAGTTPTGRPYFVMELVKGIAITSYCDTKRLSLGERLNLFREVCQAIQHAHNKGIIHRDIKPNNVLVAQYDNRPVVKVIDFGVAKATGGQLTERTLHTGFGAIVGSLEYMSPEQASLNQLDIDTRSDVYSLGVLLYELLTGTTPLSTNELRRAGILESLRLIREVEPHCPSARLSTAESLASLAASRNLEPTKLKATVKGDLDWIAMKALDKDRSRRYETVNALGEEVQRFLRGEAVLAHPPTAIYRLRKHLRRHWRKWATASAIGILIAITATILLTFQSQRLAAKNAHSQRVNNAIIEATASLNAAKTTAIGQTAPWTAARAAAKRLRELLDLQAVAVNTKLAAQQFLDEFQNLEADRRLAEQIENVVIMSATQPDLASWQQMDQQFRNLFLQEGIDPNQLSPADVAAKIRNHRSSLKLSDAFELWIGTKGQISSLGGEPATAASMQPFAEAMLAADTNPVRSGIRKLLYSGQPFTKEQIDVVVAGTDLTTLTPRTLSWLATMYNVAGAIEPTDRVFHLALDRHPDDFMLNFDFAYTLESQLRWPEAIRYFLRCTALRPDVAGVWRGLGNAYYHNAEPIRAQEALAKAVSLAPQHRESKLDYARVLLELNRYSDAESQARAAIELGCDLPVAQFHLANALYQQHRYAEALVALEKCEMANQKHPKQSVDNGELKSKCQGKISETRN